ncbi:uncharacterized protein LOC109793416 [Cajanus cajan]|uniref:uncharacterized protein LOC109793416 n=1 Tax=Cajanus cajan TaxID=3821 RepID=UPI0010FB0A59|nr:uncharacterized protein LOC109793416 [Cajanus cajan]
MNVHLDVNFEELAHSTYDFNGAQLKLYVLRLACWFCVVMQLRYGMNTSCFQALTLVEYFGEDFSHHKCLLCDVCINGPSQRLNLKDEACVLLQAIGAHNVSRTISDLYHLLYRLILSYYYM